MTAPRWFIYCVFVLLLAADAALVAAMLYIAR